MLLTRTELLLRYFGMKRSHSESFNKTSWDRNEITLCYCNGLPYRHVHCPCELCDGRPVARSTEFYHWQSAEFLENTSAEDDASCWSEIPLFLPSDSNDGETENNRENEHQVLHDSDNSSDTEIVHTPPQDVDKEPGDTISDSVIVRAVLKAMQITSSSGSSRDTFEQILKYGRDLYIEGLDNEYDEDVINVAWPKTWDKAVKIMKKSGYKDPKEYFICFCRKRAKGKKNRNGEKYIYNGKWDLMLNKTDRCRHCSRKGKI